MDQCEAGTRMPGRRPHLVVLAGPNSAGKSTAAPAVLRGQLGVLEFVNADTIARGLSAFSPERAAIEAGRIMLTRLRQLASQGQSFAFETMLASRTFAPQIRDWMQRGYAFHPLATTWRFYDNSRRRPRLLARGEGKERIEVMNTKLWSQIVEEHYE